MEEWIFFHAHYSLWESKGKEAYSSSDEYSSAVGHRIVGLRRSLDRFYLGKEESVSVGWFNCIEGEK